MALMHADLATSNRVVADGDYEVILSAIMQTARGRRFLTEYARRTRQSDIQLILSEISRLTSRRCDGLFDFKSLAPEK